MTGWVLQFSRPHTFYFRSRTVFFYFLSHFIVPTGWVKEKLNAPCCTNVFTSFLFMVRSIVSSHCLKPWPLSNTVFLSTSTRYHLCHPHTTTATNVLQNCKHFFYNYFAHNTLRYFIYMTRETPKPVSRCLSGGHKMLWSVACNSSRSSCGKMPCFCSSSIPQKSHVGNHQYEQQRNRYFFHRLKPLFSAMWKYARVLL